MFSFFFLFFIINNFDLDFYFIPFFSRSGKGPQRAEYEEKIRRMSLRHVAFRTLWLSYAEYPRLLGAADLGVCLHASSSGLDLPMKVTSADFCRLGCFAIPATAFCHAKSIIYTLTPFFCGNVFRFRTCSDAAFPCWQWDTHGRTELCRIFSLRRFFHIIFSTFASFATSLSPLLPHFPLVLFCHFCHLCLCYEMPPCVLFDRCRLPCFAEQVPRSYPHFFY